MGFGEDGEVIDPAASEAERDNEKAQSLRTERSGDMEGSKIKNIVIIILLLLNGFLLVLVGGRWAQDTQSHDAARSSAIQVIRDGGILLDDDAVPAEMNLTGLEARRDLEQEKVRVETLLGADVTVEARGGEVYRYRSARGWVQFHSTGEFLAEFTPDAYVLGETSAQEHAAQMLAQLGFDGQMTEDEVQDGDGSVVFRQTVDGVPLLGCRATMNYQDGALISITGGRCSLGQPYPVGEEAVASVATMLIRLYNGLNELGDIYSRIDSVEPAYTVSVALSGVTRLEPVWYVKTDTDVYQMDVRTGQVGRLNTAEAVTVTVQELVTGE